MTPAADASLDGGEFSAPRLRRTLLLAALIPASAIALLLALLGWDLRVLFDYNEDVVHGYELVGPAA